MFHLSGCGVQREIVEFFVEGIRSVLPTLEQYGIATREEVQVDTLSERLTAAALAPIPNGSVAVTLRLGRRNLRPTRQFLQHRF